MLLACCGCMNPVPSNHFSGNVGGVPFVIDTKKQTALTNLEFVVMSVTTNSTNFSKLSIGSVTGLNDPVVIDKSYAGAAALVDANSRFVKELGTTFGAAAGTAAKTAAK